jgi:hypothetical protein
MRPVTPLLVCNLLFIIPALGQTCAPQNRVSLSVHSSLFPSLPGQAVTLTVDIAPVSGLADPTGTVQFLEGVTDLDTTPVQSSQASVTRTLADAGAHTFHIIYSGDFNYCGAIADFGQQVDRFAASLTLAVAPATSTYGAAVTLSASLSPSPASGQVQFLEGTRVIGMAAISSGKASLTIATFAAGTHPIVAAYTGDANWYSVRSAAVTATIDRAPTTVKISGTTSPAQTTLTAKITPPAPDGAVQFADATTGATLATALVASGTANATIPAAVINASAGHPITAIYLGGANFAPSASAGIGVPAVINAAGATNTAFAPDQIVSMFGVNLTNGSSTVTVTVTDSEGSARPAYVYLASPSQINFVIPTATASGKATITLPDVLPIEIPIASVAPGLFAAIRSGTDDQPFLILYGTGIRNRSSLAGVVCNAAARALAVSYAGSQPQYPGLDQVNVALPLGLDITNVSLTVDGQTSNVIQVR